MIDGIDARVAHTDKWDLAYRAENSAQTNSSMMAVPMQANGAITSWLFAFEVI